MDNALSSFEMKVQMHKCLNQDPPPPSTVGE